MPLIPSELNINFIVAKVVNFSVKCNDTWPDFRIAFKKNGVEMDLTGVDVLMQIKTKPEEQTSLLEFSTQNGVFTIGGVANNELIFNRPVMALPPGVYYHDIQFTFVPDIIITYYKGKITAEGDVSRP